MREIKFRGKRIDNNEWVYGSLIIQDKYYIVPEGWTGYPADMMDEVLPKTVGQYIGLRDIGKKEIYEGDVVENTIIDVIVWQGRGVIVFKDGSFWLDFFDKELGRSLLMLDCQGYRYEVLGNIYDNPELKGDKK